MNPSEDILHVDPNKNNLRADDARDLQGMDASQDVQTANMLKEIRDCLFEIRAAVVFLAAEKRREVDASSAPAFTGLHKQIPR